MEKSILETIQEREALKGQESNLEGYIPLFGKGKEAEEKQQATSNLMEDINTKGIKQTTKEMQETFGPVQEEVEDTSLLGRHTKFMKGLSEKIAPGNVARVALDKIFPTPEEGTKMAKYQNFKLPTFEIAGVDKGKKGDWRVNFMKGVTNIAPALINMGLHPVNTLKAGATMADGIEDVLSGNLETPEAGMMLELAREEGGPYWELIKGNSEPLEILLNNDPAQPFELVTTFLSGGASLGIKSGKYTGKVLSALEKTKKISSAINPLEAVPRTMVKGAGAMTSGVGESLMNVSIKMNRSLKLKAKNLGWDNLPEWLLKNNVTGTPEKIMSKLKDIGNKSYAKKKEILTTKSKDFDPSQTYNSPKAREILKDLNNKLGDMPNKDVVKVVEYYAKSQKTYEGAIEVIDNAIDKLTKTKIDEEILIEMIQELNGVRNKIGGSGLTLDEMDTVKTLMDKHDNLYKAVGDAKEGARSSTYDGLRKGLRKEIIDIGNENKLYGLEHYNQQTSIAKSIHKTLLEEDIGGNLALSTAFLLGGPGLMAGSVTGIFSGIVGGTIMVKMMNNPFLRTKISNTLYKVSPKNIGNIIKKLVSKTPLNKTEAGAIKKATEQVQKEYKVTMDNVDDIKEFDPKVTFPKDKTK